MRKVIVFLIFTNFLFSYEELTVDNFDEKIKGMIIWCTATFNSRQEAINSGYEPCGLCKP